MSPEPQNLLHQITEKCTVGCPILDHCLHGGVPTKSLTELVAESGTGKTQICLQLVLSAQLPPSHGGLSASSLYIYTEYPFPIRRLKQLSRSLLSSHAKLLNSDPLDRIFLREISSAEKFVELLPDIEVLLSYWKSRLFPISVIVVDSIAALFRSDFENSCFDLKRRSSLFFKISGGLKLLAERFGLVVVVTNQVVDLIENEGGVSVNGMRIGNLSEMCSSGRRVCPALGLSWANCVNSRVFLSRDETKMRRLSVVFAPHLPQCCCEFVINGEGVSGVDMRQGNAGLPECIVRAVIARHPHLHPVLYESIILTGGSTLFPHFAERLEKELRPLVDDYHVKITSQGPVLGVSRGGSLLDFDAMCVIKAEYEELGSARCRMRFFH